MEEKRTVKPHSILWKDRKQGSVTGVSDVISFDETKYENGQVLVVRCPSCDKKFGVRVKREVKEPVNESANVDEDALQEPQRESCGRIVVIENNYCYQQEFPLYMGDNIIGREKKNYVVDCPIESGDLNIDYRHCVISVSRKKSGKLQFVLRDMPSNKGTFVEGLRLAPKERRVIEDGSVFTIGLTSVMLKLS